MTYLNKEVKMNKFTTLLVAIVITIVWIIANNTNVLADDTFPPATTSPPEDLAQNPSGTGFPHPLESDQGWGGGSDKWDIVDGLRTYSEWDNGLAFTGGILNYIEPCGWRQATISFEEPKMFNRVTVWYHGQDNAPNTYKIQYWDGSSWVDVFSTTSGHDYLKYPADPPTNWWESNTPTENTFDLVTSSKVRLALNNCDMGHGWIYEFEVYHFISDGDNDGIPDDGDYSGIEGDNPCTSGSIENCDDNCPYRYNPGQTDWDNDTAGDPCDTETQDNDGDGVDNRIDNCEGVLNFYQLDADNDTIGDVCDSEPGCGGESCGGSEPICETEC
jgi:hypothetical protein